MGLPRGTPIQTTWGDARQFVERHQGRAQYDLIFGDAFNDFSVPWHLTTREFNEKLANLLTPDGVYMINIIDVYESDAKAARTAAVQIQQRELGSDEAQARVRRRRLAEARRYGGFLGAWIKTAALTFPYISVYGTDDTPGEGLRETFVVVASKQPLDLDELGGRDDDPKFFQKSKLFEPKAYGGADLAALDLRSRGIILTDDYAPVENLLAPVAATRGDD
jgi:hypothetical protein